VLTALVLAAAVAGGNLAVTISPHPVAGHPLQVRATGQVGDHGRLYVYRNQGRSCAASVDAERALVGVARRLHRPLAINGSFDFRTSYVPKRASSREWVCAYLYAITCDASGQHCGPALGLPPDAGFSRVRVRVRAAQPRQSARAATG
jgi:hypothetical protein